MARNEDRLGGKVGGGTEGWLGGLVVGRRDGIGGVGAAPVSTHLYPLLRAKRRVPRARGTAAGQRADTV